jgi:THO complex subunit 1
MFQSFPLGDKSSVNLRGEYHVENETTFDHDIGGKDESGDKVDVDTQNNGLKPSSADGTGSQPTKPLSSDELYPIFWSLQSSFSQPKKLFDAAHLAQFKSGLGATMARFSTIKPETPNKTKQDEDPRTNPKSSPRETAEDGDDELANTFNPKYLTSRDLFELEVKCSSL